MKYITKLLRFFNVTDREDNLSITNILLMVAVVYLGINPDDLVALGGAGAAIINYMQKRYSVTAAIKETSKEKIIETIKEIEQVYEDKLNNTLTKVNDDVESIKTVRDDLDSIKRQTQDMIDKVTKSELNKLFK